MAEENPSGTPSLRDAEYAPPSRGYTRSKRRRNILIGSAVLVVLVGAVVLWRYFGSYESTDDAQVDVYLYPVSARISGYVIKVNVEDNQYVQKGDVLVEIDPKDYEVAVEQAHSSLGSAEATDQALNLTVPITSVSTSSQLKVSTSDVENSNAGITAGEAQLVAAHAQLEQAEGNDVKAQAALRRYKALVDKREVAEQDYDQAVAAAKASTASVAAGLPHVGALRQKGSQTPKQRPRAQAQQHAAPTKAHPRGRRHHRGPPRGARA